MNRDCEKLRESALEADEREIQGREREEHEAHLRSCEDCRSWMAQNRSILKGIRRRSRVELSPGAEDRILEALGPVIEKAAGRRTSWLPFSNYLVWTPAVAAFMIVLVFVMWPRKAPLPAAAPVKAKVAMRTGSVKVKLSDHPEGLHDDERELVAGHGLQTGPEGRMCIELGRDVVFLQPLSLVRIEELTTRRATLSITGGSMAVDVDPGGIPRSFMIRAPFGTVRVAGTRFRVSLESGGEVATLRGSVRVLLSRPGAGERDVQGGEILSVRDGKIQTMGERRRSELESLLEKPWLSVDESRRSLPGGAVVFSGEPASATVFIDGHQVGPAPLFLRRPAGDCDYRIVAGEREQSGRIRIRAGETTRIGYRLLPPEPRQAAEAPPPRPARKRPDALGKVLAAARKGDCAAARSALRDFKRSRDPKRAEALSLVAECYLSRDLDIPALEIYREIHRQFSKTPAGENALFEIGRLCEKHGRLDEARRAFKRHARLYRRGALAADALFRLCAIELTERRFDAALKCFRRYRKTHTRGRRFLEALFIEASIQKDVKHDFKTAADLFEQYQNSGTGKKLEAAAYRRAYCLCKVDRDRCKQAAREYLDRFPKGKHAAEVQSWPNRD